MPIPLSATPISLKQFLESVPPGVEQRIAQLALETGSVLSAKKQYSLNIEDISLHCDNEACGGLRNFRYSDSTIDVQARSRRYLFLRFTCANCQKTGKLYALSIQISDIATDGFVEKLGERPQFGDRLPSRLMEMIGPDRDLFLKGRRCESQGLGVGAFSYYRRVVEAQKDRILDRLISALERLNADESAIAEIRDIKLQPQFSQAISEIKSALPDRLLINGQNPYLVLHGALSAGLHNETDENCLEVAQAVRRVLIEFSERLSLALKDQAELDKSVELLTLRGRRPALSKKDS
ncbi:hypothetical protein [Allostella humosa]|nr:hypothetical protein [Stella humosa]